MNQLYKSITLWLLTLLFVFQTTLQAAVQDFDSLKKYTTCNPDSELKISDVARWQSKEKFREVKTSKGKEQVSVLAGYRVMFSFKDVRYYFANVKIEMSDPAKYQQDKETLVNELKYYSSTKQATKMNYADKADLNGFEHYGIDRDAIDVGGQVGMHILFYDKENLVVTIYFLNQEKKNRRFNNIEEYKKIRDTFLNGYTECLKKTISQ